MSLFYPVDHFRKREAGKAPPSKRGRKAAWRPAAKNWRTQPPA